MKKYKQRLGEDKRVILDKMIYEFEGEKRNNYKNYNFNRKLFNFFSIIQKFQTLEKK